MKAQKFIPLVVVVAGLLAYHNSFTGTFIFDDVPSISENPTIRRLWPIWQPLSPPNEVRFPSKLTVERRPVINLSLAINYALGGYNVWGYHALNLAVHILAGLTLLGIVRRTLLQPALRERFGEAANELALATAVLWTVHPLQTESVTYIIQRAESIMGLFYLLTLYCFIRGAESQLVTRSTRDKQRARLWHGLSVTACVLGMASKEVMFSAPLMVLLYDRAFLSGSFREAWQRRWPLYLGLAGAWVLFGYLAILTVGSALSNAGAIGLAWWQYLATQPGVILYYLRLSLWPSPLCLDHGWPMIRTWMSILPSAVLVASLVAVSARAWRTNPAFGFVGAWFFLILAPSSSVVPAQSALCEHRMYLSLAAVVTLVVLGLYSLAGRQSLIAIAVVAIGLGFLTKQRNLDYRNGITIWADAVAKFPGNPAAHYNLGVAFGGEGKVTEAIREYEQALRIKPDFAEAHNNLGAALVRMDRVTEAIEHCMQAVRIHSGYAEAHSNLGVALGRTGRVPEAIAHFQQALHLDPNYVEAYYNLGVVLSEAGQIEDAIRQYAEALRLNPSYAEAHYNWGLALARLGRVPEAMAHWEQALQIKPDYAEAHANLGAACVQAGRLPEAIAHYEQALRFKTDFAEAHYNLGIALERAGRPQEAIQHYEQALRIRPDYAETQNALARLRAAR